MYYEPSIKIIVLAEHATYTADTISGPLRAENDSLTQNWQDKINKRNLSVSTIQSIHKYKYWWMIQKFSDGIYYINGNGLGWSGEKLTYGRWQFNTGTGQIKPVEIAAIALLNVLVSN